LFNPGSTTFPWPRSEAPKFGMLFIEQGKPPQGEIVEIT
jgi:hypothetical protein